MEGRGVSSGSFKGGRGRGKRVSIARFMGLGNGECPVSLFLTHFAPVSSNTLRSSFQIVRASN